MMNSEWRSPSQGTANAEQGGDSGRDCPDVTVVIPCRNEQPFIGDAITSIVNGTYPHSKLQIIVVDGMSTDGTWEEAQRFASRWPTIVTCLENPASTIPAAMNIGLNAARAGVLLKVDAHSRYPKDYIRCCVEHKRLYDASNVGGRVKPIPRTKTLTALSIAAAISHPFGVGNSRFRLDGLSPIWTDAAFSGCFDTALLRRIGGYDERVHRSEDIVLNHRLRQTGGRVLLVPSIVIEYFCRSTFREFVRHSLDNGWWAIMPMAYVRGWPMSVRHFVPGVAFVSALLMMLLAPYSNTALGALQLAVITYSASVLIATIHVAFAKQRLGLLLLMPFSFGCLHLSYGLGAAAAVTPMLWRRARQGNSVR